jgi:hypothetical protein
MSINLTQNQIEKIADSLDCGMRCYYNKKTKEIAEILNLDNSFGGDEEPWQEELDKIEANWEGQRSELSNFLKEDTELFKDKKGKNLCS